MLEGFFILDNQILNRPVTYLKLVGPERAKLFQSELGVFTFYDLLFHLPFRYEDRSRIFNINELSEAQEGAQILGKIRGVKTVGSGRKQRLVATFSDGKSVMELVWFRGITYVQKSLDLSKTYLVYGKPNNVGGIWSIPHPEMQIWSREVAQSLSGLTPVYSTTEKTNQKKLNSKAIVKVIQSNISLLKEVQYEPLPKDVIQQNNLCTWAEAMRMLHQPQNIEEVEKGRHRLKYEELFLLQLTLILKKKIGQNTFKGNVFSAVGEYFNTYYQNHIPFELTGAQKRVLKEIRKDLGSGLQMNRLLQGDVGSGKTMVALLTILLALDNDFQAVMMAPTEILAQQHAQFLSESLEPLGIQIAFLSGSVKTAARRHAMEGLASGEIKVAIGTHALIEDKVKFKNLGLAIIDEQHRFGVAQRAKLWKKGVKPPHVLVMTATPIPRTLSMTYYGDLDVSVIDELPPGRKPITTVHKTDANIDAVFGFIDKEIKLGRQIYMVYPLIEESKKLDYKDLMDGYESVSRRFPMPEYQVSIVHGQLKPDAKEYEMQRFVRGETNIMVATTVIEVGVNVPNASVMVIASAERFGLSQLHQLRGRIGRGAAQSYCILMTGDKLSQDARTRIKTMTSTQDGFEIAEVDLKLRGPGDMMGTQQSGTVVLKVADIVEDQLLLTHCRNDAIDLLEKDPELKQPEHQYLKNTLTQSLREKLSWSKIS